MSKGSDEAKRQTILALFKYAKEVEIDFFTKNEYDETALDILKEDESLGPWLTELYSSYGNPSEEFETMQKAIEENDLEKFKTLVENRKYKFLSIGNLLYYSISKSELFALELIKNNVELELKLNQRSNDDDRTPLMKACELGKTEIVQALLEKAKNNQDIAVNAQDQGGWSAWYFACRNGHQKIVDLLIQNAKYLQINLNIRNKCNRTGFMNACWNGKVEVAETIINNSVEYGIDLNAQERDGWTAFHLACAKKKKEVVDLLLAKAESHKINLDIKDNYGYTGYDYWPEYFKK